MCCLDNTYILQVLNLGHNALSRRLEIAGLPALRALMLNDNQVTGVDGEHKNLHKALGPYIIALVTVVLLSS